MIHQNHCREDTISLAPLWRNVPSLMAPSATSHHNHQISPKPSPQPPPHHQLMRCKPTLTSQLQPATMKSFQQSLRSYPLPGSNNNNNNISGDIKQTLLQRKNLKSSDKKSETRCFVTSLEETKKLDPVSPFYLDYLEWNNQQQQEIINKDRIINNTSKSQQQFDHSKFMDMFRTCRQNVTTNIDNSKMPSTPTITMNNDVPDSIAAGSNNISLPYSVNDDSDTKTIPAIFDNDDKLIDSTTITTKNRKTSATNRLLINLRKQPENAVIGSNVEKQVRIQQQPASINNNQKIIPSNMRVSSSCSENLSFRFHQQPTETNYRFRLFSSSQHHPSAMEKNTRSPSNLIQRIQSAAERRAQIEDAKKERFQRHLEQNSMRNIIHGGGNTGGTINSSSFSAASRGEQFLPGHSTNSSLAFGSTQPRNIDLTRPLITPLAARPKSEIFPSGALPYNVPSHSQIDSPITAVYSKDDTNFHSNSNTSNNRIDMNSQCFVPIQAANETVLMAKQHQQLQAPSFGAASFLRAARRHDPELIPAKQKYLFREYGAPSSGWSLVSSGSGSVLKKENSVMTCSMTSTKSFQAKHHHSPSFGNGFVNNRPKKSYSMNRLDQLAQPRKRVQQRVPISTSFVKGKTSGADNKDVSPLTMSSNKTTRSDINNTTTKPTPPPKNFTPPCTKGPKVPNKDTSNGRSVPTSSSNSGSTRRPRPLSQQIETSKLDSSSPIFESPLSGGEEKTEEADKLAEYKKQLAEKRAQYRKMQEQKLSQLIKPSKQSNENKDTSKSSDDSNNKSSKPTVVTRRPRSTIITTNSPSAPSGENKSLADETKEALEKQAEISSVSAVVSPTTPTTKSNKNSSSSSPSSSSSSYSSDSSDHDSSIETTQTLTTDKMAVEATTNQKNEQSALIDISSTSLQTSTLVDKALVPQQGSIMDESVSDDEKNLVLNNSNNMKQLDQGFKQLTINELQPGLRTTCDDSVIQTGDALEKSLLQPNAIMTTSFDSSLLHSTSPAAMVAQQQQSSPINPQNVSPLTTEQIEELQNEKLKQHELERQKRKSRIQEILKGRTRKDDSTFGNKSSNDNVSSNKKNTEDEDSSMGDTSLKAPELLDQVPTSSTDSSLENTTNTLKSLLPNGGNNNQKTNGHLTTMTTTNGEHKLEDLINRSPQFMVKTNSNVHNNNFESLIATNIEQQQRHEESESGSKANGF